PLCILLQVEVNNPDEIDEIFDTISYSKGSSLIHMLHAYLGDQAFRVGLCAYLAKHAYGNACTEDLWDALASASGLAVAEIMRPWTRTAGFPVVFVEPLDVHANKLRVRLRQIQYRLPSSSTNCEFMKHDY
ncbi:Glutamyl aminopeptidase, partial [Paragonimus kellicotti]